MNFLKRPLLSYFIVLSFLLLINSCGGDDEPTPDDISCGMDQEDQVSSLAANFDGNPFCPESVIAQWQVNSATYSQLVITSAVEYEEGSATRIIISLGNTEQIEEGTYNVKNEETGLGVLLLEFRNSMLSSSYEAGDDVELSSGTLVIEEITEENIKGTFEFNLSGNTTDGAESNLIITDGNFNIMRSED